jgi:membrane-bound ClpP family serine protease
LLILLAGVCAAQGPPPDRAKPAGAEPKSAPVVDGMFISVLHPITEGLVSQIEAKIDRAIRGKDRRSIKVIIFDFNTDGRATGTPEHYMPEKLKNLIVDLERNNLGYGGSIKTFAFVHGPVSRHTLLPVLACSQIIMSEDASLGPVWGEGEQPKPEIEKIYKKLGDDRLREDAVNKLLQGERIVTKQARQSQLCSERAESRQEVRRKLLLSAQSLREDWLAGRQVIPWVVELNGRPTNGNLSSLKRRIKDAIRKGANFIILKLNSEGGTNEPGVLNAADELKKYKDRSQSLPVKIVAYVPPGRSLGEATYLALGCSEIVMGTGSSLADFAYLEKEDASVLKQKGKSLADLAEDAGYPAELFRATIDPNVRVYRVESRDHPGWTTFISEQQLKEDEKLPRPRWRMLNLETRNNGNVVKIPAERARAYDIVRWASVDSLGDLYGKLDIRDSERVTVSRDDWLDHVAEFFREPWVKVLLLLIGIAGLILEVKMPGTSIPGIIAAVCFVLFFWSHSFVNDWTVLAVLLFLLGLVLLGLEIFVFPGMGALGVSGVLLLIVSLLLVTMEKMPESPEEWQGLGWTVGSFGLSLVGAIVVAVAIASFLPQIPYANRLMLQPPEEAEGEHVPTAAAAGEAAALLGAIGIAETPLRPAGKARFGDDYIDVVSQGDYITPGSRVQVIEIEGNRIVVKQV